MSKQTPAPGSPGSFFQGISDQIRLVWFLMLDKRISPLLKLIPFGSLLYLISPFDLPTPIDDLGVLWGFAYLFIELCPDEIVAEHKAAIEKTVVAQWKEDNRHQGFDDTQVEDAEFEDLPKDNTK